MIDVVYSMYGKYWGAFLNVLRNRAQAEL